MNKLKLIIGAVLIVFTAIIAAWDVSAYNTCTYGCGTNSYYDEGNMGHGHVEVVPSGSVHSAVYPPNMYMATGLRAPHYIYIQPPVYTTSSSHAVYPYYGMLSSRYGYSQFYGGEYSGYSGTYGSIGNYGRYSGRFVY